MGWWLAELGLHEHLHHMIRFVIEHLVRFRYVLKVNSMRQHDRRIEFPSSNSIEKLLPIAMYRCLSYSDESNPKFHDRSDVKVIGI